MTDLPVKTLSQWLAWLESRHPEVEIDLGLERVQAIAATLGVLTPAPVVITVAGTNGKGSTVAFLEAMLQAGGYRTGVFTSPHFLRFNERIRVNGQMVADDALCSAFARINACPGACELTYFEFATLAALLCFMDQPLDYVVLEVGLGGRLDATNVVSSHVAVITSIGLDHQDWLGDTLEAIGAEKAGIIRYQQPVVFGGQSMPETIARRSIELEAPLFRRGLEFSASGQQSGWRWRGLDALGREQVFENLPWPGLELDNAATALQALAFLPNTLTRDAIDQGLAMACLPGRAQKLHWCNDAGQSIEVMLDVSHNPHAVEKLASRLQREPAEGQTHAVLGMCKDKDHVGVIDLLAPQVDCWIATAFDSPRALSVAVLEQALTRTDAPVEAIPHVEAAFMAAVNRASSGDRVLVVGSFMTVAAVLAAFERRGITVIS